MVWLIEMVNALNFSKSASFGKRALGVGTPKSLSFGNPKVTRTGWVWRRFLVLILIGFLVSFILAIGAGYIHILPSLGKAFHDFAIYKSDNSTGVCDIFDGSWVPDDDSYPLYNASACPFAEQGFNCIGNGRRDKGYLNWRWKPKNCDIPRFNVQSTLEKLRGKRVVFVGDSMSRTQWESLICLLMTGVEDKKSVYEVNGNKITKQIRYLGVRFKSYNFTIEFFRSVYLVQHAWNPRHAPKRVRSTLKLDKLDDISKEWIDSDILIFNSGQWWVPWKLYETGCYFQVGNSIKLGMSIPSAFRTALDTWASWVENTIDTNRTRIFFRTFEPSHWSGEPHRFCNVTQYPTSEIEGRDSSIFSDIIIEIVKNMTVPITVLQITSMSAFRSDAHVGTWNRGPSPDCSHWCLPGLPDLWNEILLSYVLTNDALPLQPMS